MAEISQNRYTTLLEEEKLLPTSNFSFPPPPPPQCFYKTCTADSKKPGLVWGRVKTFFIKSTHNSYHTPRKTKVFRDILQSTCLSVRVSVCQSVCPSGYKTLVSVKALAGVSSQI